jgi:hypothetical protein
VEGAAGTRCRRMRSGCLSRSRLLPVTLTRQRHARAPPPFRSIQADDKHLPRRGTPLRIASSVCVPCRVRAAAGPTVPALVRMQVSAQLAPASSEQARSSAAALDLPSDAVKSEAGSPLFSPSLLAELDARLQSTADGGFAVPDAGRALFASGSDGVCEAKEPMTEMAQ